MKSGISVLFLDDDKHRWKQFKKKVPDAVWVQTAAECIEELQTQDLWHFVFLDHDLGGETFVDSSKEDCGMEVVRWIVKNEPAIRNVFVHTMNPPAGDEMAKTLRRAKYKVDYIPFHVLVSRLNDLK